METSLLDRIANLIFPYLKTKHKGSQAQELAKKILEEIDKNSPSWYTYFQEEYMPSQETKWYKDKRLVEMLDQVREKNLAFMAVCYFCSKKSEGIKSIGHRLYPVCSSHETLNTIPDKPDTLYGQIRD